MSRLDVLRDQFNQVRAGIEEIETRAATETRDLTEQESTDVDALYVRAEQLKTEIEPLAERHRSLAATADVLSRIGVASSNPVTRAVAPAVASAATSEDPIGAAAEYLAGYFRSVNPRSSASERAAAVQQFEMLTRTVAEQLLADTPGILPVPVVGPILKLADSRRPAFASLTQRPMPSSGKTFERPVITQRVNVGLQTNEGDELTSRKMTLANDTVTKKTYGGTLELSQQDLDWTDPGILSIVLQDFVDMYAEVTDTAAATYLTGTVATTASALTRTNRGTWVSSFVTAAQAVYSAVKRWPDTLWLGTSAWAVMASAVDGEDKLIFPDLGMGAIDLTSPGGGSPLGLKVVLAPNMTATKAIVGSKSLVEAYEQKRGLLQGYQTSNLMAEVAYYGYVGFWGKVEGFVKMVDSAATPVIL